MAVTPYQLRAVGDAAINNLVINGNMDFWQRGTTFSLSGNVQKYLADRFCMESTASFTSTVTQSTDVPTLAQSGYQSRYSLLVTNGTGASPGSAEYIIIEHRVEGQDYQAIHGRKARLQFWCKSSVTGTFAVSLRNNANNRDYVASFTVVSASTWEKKTFDIALDSSGTWLFDNGMGVDISIALTAGSGQQTSTLNTWQAGSSLGATGQTNWGGTTSATFQLAQMALIPGNYDSSLSIPFHRAGRSVGHELQMCQRYYEKSFAQGNFPGSQATTDLVLVSHGPTGTNGVSASAYYKTAKRASPTLTIYNNAGTSARVTEIDGGNTTVTVTASTGFSADTNDDHMRIFGTLTNSGSAGFGFCWTADAEL